MIRFYFTDELRRAAAWRSSVFILVFFASEVSAQSSIDWSIQSSVRGMVNAELASRGSDTNSVVIFRTPELDYSLPPGGAERAPEFFDVFLHELNVTEIDTDDRYRTLEIKLSGFVMDRIGIGIPFTRLDTIGYEVSNDPMEVDRYEGIVTKDSSLWSNVIQPLLVGLGAAAIIALFFFVRS